MKKLALAALALLPLAAGCYAEAYPPVVYTRPARVRVYVPHPPRVYVAPPRVYVAPPPRVHVYW